MAEPSQKQPRKMAETKALKVRF